MQPAPEFFLFCENGTISNLVANQPYALVVKTTHFCPDKCAHCFENSGPDQPKNFIPEKVITGYIDQALQDPLFSKNFIVTGGEPTSAYEFLDAPNARRHYFTNIIEYALNRKVLVAANTNAYFVDQPFCDTVFNDIHNLMLRQRPKVITSKNARTHYPFEIQLSLDRFHNNCMERDFEVLKRLSQQKINGATYAVRVSSFDFDRLMFDELLNKLRNAGISAEWGQLIDPKTQEVKNDSVVLVNGRLALEYSSAPYVSSNGRATNIPYAFHNPTPQFTILCPNNEVLVAFDSFGNVTLGAAEGEKITVPWRGSDGNPRPLVDIRADLVTATKAAEAKYFTALQTQNESTKCRNGFLSGLFRGGKRK